VGRHSNKYPICGNTGSLAAIWLQYLVSRGMTKTMKSSYIINNSITILLLLSLSQFFYSCNFNITDNPGPQISTTITTAKERGSFICSYNLKGSKINGLRVESVFAEKKYSLGDGIFGKFSLDCCESQLVISFKDDNNITTLNDVAQTWEVLGFKVWNSKILVKDYNGILFPDSIQIIIVPDVNNKTAFEKLTLYKIK
jgi:hypothetical protein